MMMRSLLIKLCIILSLPLFVFFQTENDKYVNRKIVFYNVENLFDTIDNPFRDDSEFLPKGKNKWNSLKYFEKIRNIGRVLEATDSVNLPVLIGLCEIENMYVIKDLVNKTPLIKGKYKIIHEESSDVRGIDVALIYQPDYFKEITHRKIKVFNKKGNYKVVKNLLYVTGIIGKNDTLHIIVNHWKSRCGSTEETEPVRIQCAKAVRAVVDSIFQENPKANIIIMGDFNDNPTNESIKKHLKAEQLNIPPSKTTLYNLMYNNYTKGIGSYYYKKWYLFDQIIVSSNLISKAKKKLSVADDATVFNPEWMLYKNKTGELIPRRSYLYGKYYSGYSDHLPVYVTLKGIN